MSAMIYQQQPPTDHQLSSPIRDGKTASVASAGLPTTPCVVGGSAGQCAKPMKSSAGSIDGSMSKDAAAGAGPGGVLGPIDDDDLRLEVTCGQNQAVLYTSRLQLGSKGTCVLFENAWLTPNEFQYVSGRETAKDWKRSIKHHGKSLKVLIAKGILTTTPPARCDCGQCTVPKKDKDMTSWKTMTDCAGLLSPVMDTVKTATGSVNTCDPWRTQSGGVVCTPSVDGSSAFRAPIDTLRTSDCASAAALPNGVGSRMTADCALDRAAVNGVCNGSFSPQAVVAPKVSGYAASSSVDGLDADALTADSKARRSQKRSRSPSSGADCCEPPASKSCTLKSQSCAAASPSGTSGCGRLVDGVSNAGAGSAELTHSKGSSSTSDSCSRGSSAPRPSQQSQYSPADGGHRRRDQSSSSSSSAARHCQTPQQSQRQHHSSSDSSSTAGFRSPQSTAGGYQTQKTSPSTAAVAAAVDRQLAADASQSPYVISPLAATPYFPFLAATTAASQLPGVCYPNPYMMLPLAAAAAYSSTSSQFPYGWSSSSASSTAAPGSISPGVRGVADSLQQDLQTRSASGSTAAAAFDFPWMRGCVPSGSGSFGSSATATSASKLSPSLGAADPYDAQLMAAKQSLGLAAAAAAAAAQNPYSYVRGAGGFGAASLLADGLDAYCRRAACELPGAASAADVHQSFFDGQAAAAAAHLGAASGAGFYPPLFQSAYFGIPSR